MQLLMFTLAFITKGAGSTFASLPDGEGLKGRREFLHLGLQIWLRGSFCSQTLLRGINL